MSKKKGGRASNWRQIQGQHSQVHEVELPSGMVVFSRKPDMLDFVLGGDVPNSFFGEMMKLAGASQDGSVDVSTLSPDAMKGLVDLGGRMMITCCSDPTVWDGATVIQDEGDGSGDKLGVKDIGANDKMAFFTWATGDADALKTFRTETGSVSEPALNGEGVQPATV